MVPENIIVVSRKNAVNKLSKKSTMNRILLTVSDKFETKVFFSCPFYVSHDEKHFGL